MAERDRSKVTLDLRESDARWLEEKLRQIRFASAFQSTIDRITSEIKHALAECECAGEVGG